ARRGDRTMSDACCGGSPDTSCGPAPAAVRPEPAARPTASPLLVVVVSALLIVAGALTARLGYTVPSVVLYLGAIGLSIPTPARRAWRSLRTASLDINVLMVIAVVGAMILGDWLEAAAVVWLFGIAQWLETRSLSRARGAIRALMTLTPATASVRRGG